ncbi:MAG: hypothetical protein ACOY4O_13795 [Pseudomonadota bacterium]|jgi:hypothetical protein
MNWQTTALGVAGVIGSGVAAVHGVLTQRLMVRPFEELAHTDKRFSATIRRLIPVLLHFSTAAWLAGGIALIVAAIWLDAPTRFATGIFVGGLYLFGVIGNFWGTRGRHPGWMLLAVALALIAFAIMPLS